MEDNIKLNGKLIIALSRSMKTIHKKSDLLFSQNNLTMAQFAVLEALLHNGDLTIGEIIDAVLSTSGNMTVVIRNLEQRGWVKRIKNQLDNRSFLICLTKSGKALIETVFKQHMELVAQALAPISDEEKTVVINILKKLQ